METCSVKSTRLMIWSGNPRKSAHDGVPGALDSLPAKKTIQISGFRGTRARPRRVLCDFFFLQFPKPEKDATIKTDGQKMQMTKES